MKSSLIHKYFILIIVIKLLYNYEHIHFLNKVNITRIQNKPIYLSPNGKLRTLEYQGQTRLPTIIN